MDFEALKVLFEEFDLAAFLPDLSDVMGWVEMLLRIAVMAGPLLLLLFGLLYLLIPPKEANHGLGYRFWWGMSSLDAWQFTQHLAGLVWSGLGVISPLLWPSSATATGRWRSRTWSGPPSSASAGKWALC